MNWKEFKPAFKFLGLFLGIYFVGNIVYGLFIESYNDADPITVTVTRHTIWFLNALGQDVKLSLSPIKPTVLIENSIQTILSVYEGCNGINVMIVFCAFLFAFGGAVKTMGWFLPLGILIIHFTNVLRITMLYFISLNYQHYFYYIHKYIFTAVIYLVVFILWAVWFFIVGKQSKTKRDVSAA